MKAIYKVADTVGLGLHSLVVHLARSAASRSVRPAKITGSMTLYKAVKAPIRLYAWKM